MWKLLRILLVPVVLLQGCGNSSEETVSSPTTTTQKIIWVLHPPPTPEMKVPTTLAPTTTTSTVSTYLAASFETPAEVWDIIAECESHGNWGARGTYEGGLQFLPYTWTAYVAAGKPYGLQNFPLRAYEATREQQIIVAIRVRDGIKGSSDPYLNAQGWNAWPNCRHDAGV